MKKINRSAWVSEMRKDLDEARKLDPASLKWGLYYRALRLIELVDKEREDIEMIGKKYLESLKDNLY